MSLLLLLQASSEPWPATSESSWLSSQAAPWTSWTLSTPWPTGNSKLVSFLCLLKLSGRFGSHVELEMLRRDLSYLVEVRETEISLTPLQLCSRDIELVLGEVGRLPVAELEYQFEAKLGRELPLEPLGFESVSELLSAMNDTLTVKGRGVR